MNQTIMKIRGRREPLMRTSKYHCLQTHLSDDGFWVPVMGTEWLYCSSFLHALWQICVTKWSLCLFPKYNRPRLSSEQGNLVFHAGSSKNIEFRTGPLGKIKLNEEDLAELFSQVILLLVLNIVSLLHVNRLIVFRICPSKCLMCFLWLLFSIIYIDSPVQK